MIHLGPVVTAVLVAGMAAAAAAAAQQAPGGIRFPATLKGQPTVKYLASSAYWDNLRKQVLNYERGVGPCRAVSALKRAKTIAIAKPVTIGRLGKLPQWLEIVDVKGCGKVFPRVVFTAIFPGDKIAHVPLLRGHSRTDPVLQWDIIRPLLAHARSVAKKAGCKKKDTVRLLGAKFAGNDDKTGGWREVWGVGDCKGVHEYAVIFTPSSKGGTTWQLKRRRE